MQYQDEYNWDTILAQGNTDNYIYELSEYLKKQSFSHSQGLNLLIDNFKNQVDKDGDTFLIGSGYSAELVDHANVDLLKFANVRVCEIRVPTLTAYGNDYPSSLEFCEYFKHHRVNENTLLILINLGDYDSSLNKIQEIILSRGGRCFLITNNFSQAQEFGLDNIYLDTEDIEMAGDLVQSLMHYITLSMSSYITKQSDFDWASSYSRYCDYLSEVMLQMPFRKDVASIGDTIYHTILTGKRLFVFGNGGSAAIASYFTNYLQQLFDHRPTTLLSIINLGQYIHYIQESIKIGSYKSKVYSDIIKKIGIAKDDVIIGISTSGNSDNIISPYVEFKEAMKIAVLGFDGGKLGRSNLTDQLVIVPDVYNRRSYAIAEDGQRIIFTCILKYLRQKLNV